MTNGAAQPIKVNPLTSLCCRGQRSTCPADPVIDDDGTILPVSGWLGMAKEAYKNETESLVAQSEAGLSLAMAELYKLGFEFLLDDFGTAIRRCTHTTQRYASKALLACIQWRLPALTRISTSPPSLFHADCQLHFLHERRASSQTTPCKTQAL